MSSLLLLAACGGGGGGSSSGSGGGGDGGDTNTAPSVDAGADQTVLEGELVMLDANASDADGDSLTLTWTRVSGPNVTLSDATVEDPTFTAPSIDGTEDIVLRLTADDGTATSSDDITITVTESSVTADAGYSRVVAAGTTVSLDATIDDPAGLASWSWSQIAGTAVSLSDDTDEDPSFTAPSVAATEGLVFRLTVNDGSGSTLTDDVVVEVWVAADSSSDATVLGDYSGRDGWGCTVDPEIDPELSINDAGAYQEYSGNGIPSHATGTFPNPGNPTAIAEVAATYDINQSPEKTDTPTTMQLFGITLDGIKLDRFTGESYNNAGEWNYEALTPALAEQRTASSEWVWLGTDCSNAHVQPSGAYHYHGLMEAAVADALAETQGVAQDMILIGYAADGFPIYARYGYADPDDAASGLVVVEASWELKSGTRSGGPGGAYDGTFNQDWEYVENSGDLDMCGGRFGVTPEYPDGIYHYYITDDYPYIPWCVYGTPDNSFGTLGTP